MNFVFYLLSILVFLIIDFIFDKLNRKYDFSPKATYNIGQSSSILAIFLLFLIYQLIN